MINAVYITQIINEAKNAVDCSDFGPIILVDPNDISKKSISQISLNVFGAVLNAMLKDLGEDNQNLSKRGGNSI